MPGLHRIDCMQRRLEKTTNHHMENEKRTLVKLETTMGNITVALYNETPKHRDNFIKLVKEGYMTVRCSTGYQTIHDPGRRSGQQKRIGYRHAGQR